MRMLQDEDHNGKSDLSKHIDRFVECHGDGWAQTIGLQDASPKFHKDICKAILSCIAMLDAGNSKRASEIRKELERVNRAAAVAAKSLRNLHCALQAMTPQWRERIDNWRFGKLDLDLIPARAQWVTVIGNRAFAQITDKGGRRAMTTLQQGQAQHQAARTRYRAHRAAGYVG
jgi:hypothetical protein